jgi:DNA-binding NarL/FixJ family response regulator
MPKMTGIEFLDVIREDDVLKSSIVFVLTTSDDDRDIVASYRRNVEGYIVKADAKESLKEALSSLQAYQWSVLMLPSEHSQKVA